MLVSCPTCSAKFNVPDAKIAGKRARMKCKKCGDAIPLDGTHLTTDEPVPSSRGATKKRTRSAPRRPPTSSGISTRWRVSEPSGKEHEMSLADVARTYSKGGFEPGTLVCAPGRDDWLPPYDHSQVMDMALPADELAQPRPSQPTFSDNTLTLGAEESAELTNAAAKASDFASLASPQESSFFGNNDVDDAMDAFDNIVTVPPGNTSKALTSPIQLKNVPASGRSSAPLPRPSSAPLPRPSSTAPPSSRRPSLPPPSSQRPGSSVPAKPAAASAARDSNSRGGAAPPSSVGPPSSTRPLGPSFAYPTPQGTSRPPVPPPSLPSAALSPASTRHGPSSRPPATSHAPTFSPPALSGLPAFQSPNPAFPSYAPRPASAPPYPAPGYSASASAPAFVPSPPSFVPSAPAFAPSPPSFAPAAPSVAPPAHISVAPSQPARSSPFHSGALSEPTFGTLTAPPPRQNSSSLIPLVVAIVLVFGALGGIYLFRPALFQRGMNRIQVLLGMQVESPSSQKADGPPFDAQAAGEILGQSAAQAGKCREPGGPVGKGRAQVLYATDGAATSVAVSRPFHETSVGSCLQEMFKKTRVPAFGGDPVVVSKTFDVE